MGSGRSTYEQASKDLRTELDNAVALARENFARHAGSNLAKQAGVSEDMVWMTRRTLDGRDEVLEGQVMSGYEASTVQGIIKEFANVLSSDVTTWEATADLHGVEVTALFGGLKVIVWGVVYE